MQTGDDASRRSDVVATTARRALVVVTIVVLALLVWQIVDALLLLFMGLLLAVFFRGLATRLADHSPLSSGWALGVVAFVAVAVLVFAAFLLGPRVSHQFAQLSETLPQSVNQLKQGLGETSWGQAMLGQMQSSGGGLRMGGNVFSRLSGVASGVLGILTNLILVLFAAIFFAVNPRLYRTGILRLIPKRRVDRVREVMDASGHALWKWLMGKLVAMVFVGVVVTVGLWVLGVPLALVLGLIAGLLDFVPFIGPIVAAVPGVLLALTIGPTQALYTALLYFVAQQIEGNVVTPLIQQKEVSLPPVLVIFAVIAAGLVFGIIGIIVATPLVVVIMVFTRMLYVEDALGKSLDAPES